jgi:2-polyprenyl-6-methoxyphenol hydroxylase-like FAD-dependent oxidoreductase
LQTLVTVAADGLGHGCLRGVRGFADRVQEQSRVGLGAAFATVAPEYPEGGLTMAIGKAGYVGLVRVSHECLNMAAAVDPQALKASPSPSVLVKSILEEAGVAIPGGMTQAEWSGTPALTRMLTPVAVPGVFVIGDAAGYVEPFTGEGITWGLTSGLAVADFVELALRVNSEAACRGWQRTFRQAIRKRQAWCRRFAWLLRHPAGVDAALRLVARWPQLARPVLRSMNDSRLGIPMRSA